MGTAMPWDAWTMRSKIELKLELIATLDRCDTAATLYPSHSLTVHGQAISYAIHALICHADGGRTRNPINADLDRVTWDRVLASPISEGNRHWYRQALECCPI